MCQFWKFGVPKFSRITESPIPKERKSITLSYRTAERLECFSRNFNEFLRTGRGKSYSLVITPCSGPLPHFLSLQSLLPTFSLNQPFRVQVINKILLRILRTEGKLKHKKGKALCPEGAFRQRQTHSWWEAVGVHGNTSTSGIWVGWLRHCPPSKAVSRHCLYFTGEGLRR